MAGQHIVTWDDYVPDKANITCGYCRRPVTAAKISKAIEVQRWDDPAGFGVFGVRVGVTYVCENRDCFKPSIVFFDLHNDQGDTTVTGIAAQLPRGQAEPIEGLPQPRRNGSKSAANNG